MDKDAANINTKLSLLARMTASSMAAVVTVLAAFSCSSDHAAHAPAVSDKDSLPFMQSWGVSTLISDSGVIRYKITAEEWFIYNTTQPPRWTFMKGILLEKFDSTNQSLWNGESNFSSRMPVMKVQRGGWGVL